MRSRLLIGPFAEVHRASESLLKFTVPRDLRERVREPALRDGLKISPDKIYRAYKGRRGIWLIIEFERGYDLYKHFKLAERERYARRIPRLVIGVCPRCGEEVVQGLCLECNMEVERVRYLEVWRDPLAREVIVGPLAKIEEEGSVLIIHLGSERLKIPKTLLHETLVSLVKRADGIYAKLLAFEGARDNHEGVDPR